MNQVIAHSVDQRSRTIHKLVNRHDNGPQNMCLMIFMKILHQYDQLFSQEIPYFILF